jgi:RimJ/RimL family protein N-acetyltransferase
MNSNTIRIEVVVPFIVDDLRPCDDDIGLPGCSGFRQGCTMRFPHDVPTLTDGVVTLRAHSVDDVPAVLEQSLDPVSVAWTTVPVPYTLDDAKRFVTQAMPGGWADEVEFGFAIEAEGRFAGTCSLRVAGDARAEIAYGAHPWARGRGVMDRALRLLVGWGFSTGRFETLVWWAQTGNWASRKTAWKLGFSCVGPLEAWLPQRGGLEDAWVGVLRRTDARSPRHPWYDAPRILGPQVVLRPQQPSDASRIVEAMTDERSRRWLRLPSPYTLDSAVEFLESRTEAMANGTCVHWAIADPTSDDLLGVINLFQIQQEHDAEVGYWSHPEARGRGVMTEACRLAVRHGFVPVEDGGLGLKRITAYAGVENAASRHVIESVGFKQYGVERQGERNGEGVVCDLACYDLLVGEFVAS